MTDRVTATCTCGQLTVTDRSGTIADDDLPVTFAGVTHHWAGKPCYYVVEIPATESAVYYGMDAPSLRRTGDTASTVGVSNGPQQAPIEQCEFAGEHRNHWFGPFDRVTWCPGVLAPVVSDMAAGEGSFFSFANYGRLYPSDRVHLAYASVTSEPDPIAEANAVLASTPTLNPPHNLTPHNRVPVNRVPVDHFGYGGIKTYYRCEWCEQEFDDPFPVEDCIDPRTRALRALVGYAQAQRDELAKLADWSVRGYTTGGRFMPLSIRELPSIKAEFAKRGDKEAST